MLSREPINEPRSASIMVTVSPLGIIPVTSENSDVGQSSLGNLWLGDARDAVFLPHATKEGRAIAFAVED